MTSQLLIVHSVHSVDVLGVTRLYFRGFHQTDFHLPTPKKSNYMISFHICTVCSYFTMTSSLSNHYITAVVTDTFQKDLNLQPLNARNIPL